MASASMPLKHPEDITECPVCTEIFQDSRVLPCTHTYCLRCVEKLGTGKSPGDKISCPLCRKDFVIPPGGVGKLPKNLFVEKLLEAKKLTEILRREEPLCDVCSKRSETEVRKVVSKAEVYCIDCRKNLCNSCFVYHQEFKLRVGSHKVIELDKTLVQADDLLLKFPEITCDKHPDKNLEIFCLECKATVCMLCYIKAHNSHKISDVKEVADDLNTQLSADTDTVLATVEDCKAMLNKIAEEDRVLIKDVEKTRKDVDEKTEKLKLLLDQRREHLFTKLTDGQTRQIKANENVRLELERQIEIMEGFIRYSKELKQKGTACDLAKVAETLHVRSQELSQFDVEVDLPANYTTATVSFEATMPDDDINKVLGDVNITDEIKDYADSKFFESCELVETIPNEGGSVTGIATLGEELFVVRWRYPQIQVYHPFTDNTNVQRLVNVGSEHKTFRGLASCEFNNCLYVSDEIPEIIHKVCPVTNTEVADWSVNGTPYGVSVNSAHNLLVACNNTNEIQEYTTDGKSVRVIKLQAEISSPVHVVQLKSGDYGITHKWHHARKVHRYSVIDTDGKVIKSKRQVSYAYGFAVSRGSTKTLVASWDDNLVLLSSDSLAVEQLPDAFNCGFNNPYCVHFAKSGRALYVGEWGGRCIKCFKRK